MTRIAIIGCGIVGAAIAYELSAIASLEITLIDRETPATGSTGAALGILMGVISHKTKGRNWRLRLDSLERYETLIPELVAITGEEILYNRQGLVMLRFDVEDLPRWQKLQNKRQNQGFPLELWSKEELRDRLPHIQDDRIVGAVYSPRDRQVHPQQLTHSLIAAAQKRGVTCRFHSPVTDIATIASKNSQLRHCTHLQTPQNAIATDYVIITAGIGSMPLTSALQETLDIRPVLGQALHLRLERDRPSPPFQPVITGNDIHIVPLGNQEYWLGATVEFPDENGNLKAQTALLETVKQQAFRYYPALADAEILSTWSGLRPRPEGRSAPIIENLPGYNNVILATGHYRNGIFLATATALWVRDLLD
ncbi:MAG: FAD-dependent oxidoreductase [Jaaginema sp. PMC 1079.18]|nr:FAD-dependent oxidoreductase [Jaaginema sp. PMC 1080.18]MEC4850681.1 FAD-dependent oxidoreductase [Jaaginema sp. PMC 1079.18]MEC4864564.1 FAD-dependent oxidoreductase [Jaaginema sp. PMC 1078.18]